MSPILLIGGLFFVIFAVLGVVLFFILKKADPKNQDSSENPKTAQNFLPFKEIRDDMIILPNQRFRMVLECTSLNYNLKTDAERDVIEASFQRFLNSVDYPITLFLQTKTIDNRKRLSLLDQDIAKTVEVYPGIRKYAEYYREQMETLNATLGNSHQKKRYIIVSYDDVGELSSLSEEERELYARKELLNRCANLVGSLDGIGIHAVRLNTAGLFNLLYSCYYRDDYTYSDAIGSGDPFGLFVNGKEDVFAGKDKKELLALVCQEALTRIVTENLDTTEQGERLLSILNEMKGEL